MLDNEVINQYDGLIFDMDGTVIDTMPSHAKAWEMVIPLMATCYMKWAERR